MFPSKPIFPNDLPAFQDKSKNTFDSEPVFSFVKCAHSHIQSTVTGYLRNSSCIRHQTKQLTRVFIRLICRLVILCQKYLRRSALEKTKTVSSCLLHEMHWLHICCVLVGHELLPYVKIRNYERLTLSYLSGVCSIEVR